MLHWPRFESPIMRSLTLIEDWVSLFCHQLVHWFGVLPPQNQIQLFAWQCSIKSDFFKYYLMVPHHLLVNLTHTKVPCLFPHHMAWLYSIYFFWSQSDLRVPRKEEHPESAQIRALTGLPIAIPTSAPMALPTTILISAPAGVHALKWKEHLTFSLHVSSVLEAHPFNDSHAFKHSCKQCHIKIPSYVDHHTRNCAACHPQQQH